MLLYPFKIHDLRSLFLHIANKLTHTLNTRGVFNSVCGLLRLNLWLGCSRQDESGLSLRCYMYSMYIHEYHVSTQPTWNLLGMHIHNLHVSLFHILCTCMSLHMTTWQWREWKGIPLVYSEYIHCNWRLPTLYHSHIHGCVDQLIWPETNPDIDTVHSMKVFPYLLTATSSTVTQPHCSYTHLNTCSRILEHGGWAWTPTREEESWIGKAEILEKLCMSCTSCKMKCTVIALTLLVHLNMCWLVCHVTIEALELHCLCW